MVEIWRWQYAQIINTDCETLTLSDMSFFGNTKYASLLQEGKINEYKSVVRAFMRMLDIFAAQS